MPYHLIDIIEPSEPFSAGLFLKFANEAIEDISKRGKPVIAVGGTALYIKALLYGLFEGPSADEQIRAELKTQAQKEGLESLYQQLQSVDPNTAGRISSNDEKRIIRALEVLQDYRTANISFSEPVGKRRNKPQMDHHRPAKRQGTGKCENK